MKSPFNLACAVALGFSLVLTGCSKSSDTSSTTSASATTAPADATSAPADAAAATPDPSASTTSTTVGGTTVSSSNGGGGGKTGFIEIPVYPASTQNKDQGMAMSANGTSVNMTVYTSKDDAKAVADWYKSHLPAAWKNGILTSDGKSVGTFSNEMDDGDQTVIVASQDDKTTRIQLTTKHGK